MKNLTFFINDIQIVKLESDIDLSKINSAFKRRISNIDKIVLSLLSKTYTYDINEIVFSSEYGELERLKLIIEQYQSFNEVSPIQFTGSVHNYPIGYFSQIKKSNVPYSAISADKNSVSAGIIKSVISQNKKILFCYADYFETFKGFSFVVSKEKCTENSIECKISDSCVSDIDEFEEIIPFLLNKKSFIKLNECILERIEN